MILVSATYDGTLQMMQNTADDLQLTKSERNRLGLVGDALIGGGAGLPSAREADVQGQWIDRVLAARPDLVGALRKVATASGDPRSALAGLTPAELEHVRYAVAAAYLINPRVRSLLGYPGGVPEKQPAYPDEADAYLEDGILNAVIERGPIYRQTPKSTP